MLRFLKRNAIFFVVLVLISGVLFYAGSRPRLGEHVVAGEAPIPGLPPEATDVCYCLRMTEATGAYEFSATPSAVLTWADERGWTLSRIKDEAVDVPRYKRFQDAKGDSPAEGEGDASTARVTQGYVSRCDTGKHRLLFAYDEPRERAYVYVCKP